MSSIILDDMNEDKVHDECGMYAVYSATNQNLASTLYYGLYQLQHRGQESAGMAVSYGRDIKYYKNTGLVSEVFSEDKLALLPEGDLALGHVRYCSKEEVSVVNAQPIVYNGRCGHFAIAMNGKITNAKTLRNELIKEGITFQSNIDVEVIADLVNKYTVGDDIVEGVRKAVEYLEGSFAFVIMSSHEIIAVRDRFGLRPLAYGRVFDDYHVASETCALDALGVEDVRDIEAGEILVIDNNGPRSYYIKNIERRHCIFEYVYTARADSVIDGMSVYKARFECGRRLAEKLKIDADLVAGCPDSAIVAARGYAAGSGIPYIDVLEKNRYVGRTFIQPTQEFRENSVKIKLNVHKANVQGKRIILVDDSIVRGTTSRKIVDLLKKSGAKEVHMVIASPIVKHPCYTGIDIETYDQLIGAYRDQDEICGVIGADSLHFMDVEDLIDCCKCIDDMHFCAACFDGDYPDNIEQKILNKKGE